MTIAPRRTARAPRLLSIARPAEGWTAAPLEEVTVAAATPVTVVARDARGREYFRGRAAPRATFAVAGALGRHVVQALDNRGRVVDRAAFEVDARTRIDDAGGDFREFLDILYRTMCCYAPDGASSLRWRGRTYRYFVHWILDHAHTAKGMQYFSPHAAGLVDLLRETQREDGMIWSNVNPDPGPGWFDTAYGPYDYCRRWKGLLLTRQPVENHPEYCFVDALHRAWKGSGDDAWMRRQLRAARRALDYGATDRSRWSKRFGLLKRGYTIDSWDFQVHDEYEVDFPVPSTMLIDPDRTKFGVFFGDNTGHILACRQLAEMLEQAGRARVARRYRDRAREMLDRLNALAWNGRFFVHRVEEDPSVKRDLGVDEKSQIAFSNAYSVNRGLPHEQVVAIIRTYRDLKRHLPPGSPGEWYAIYPPFGRGFGKESARWQYMNGGVHPHAAGELALGAFEHGFEAYGADILRRVLGLGRQHGRVHFAYTGAVEPPPPPPVFTTIDLAGAANMDLLDAGAEGVPGWMLERAGNDLRNLPVGRQVFAGIPFDVPDPSANGRRAAAAVGRLAGLPATLDVAVGAAFGALYLLHTVGRTGPSGLAGVLTLHYADGSEHAVGLQSGKHIAGWWFPALKGPCAGVAWKGPNPLCTAVGPTWAAIENPHPEKAVERVTLSAAPDGALYAVLGMTRADRMPYVAPGPVSHGGPDNWSGGCCTLALMEGLAGVADAETAYERVRLSPRWTAAGVKEVALTARYAASKGYVSYRFRHDEAKRAIDIELTGGGRGVTLRVLLPRGARTAEATVDGRKAEVAIERIESSLYAVMDIPLPGPARVRVRYGGR